MKSAVVDDPTVDAPPGRMLRAFAGDGALMMARGLSSLLFSTASSILIARGLGVEGKGQFALLLLSVNVLHTFGELGLSEASVYFFNRETDRSHTSRSFLGLTLGIAAVLAMVAVLVVPQLEFARGIGAWWLRFALGLTVVALFLERMLSAALLGMRVVKAILLTRILQDSIYLTLVAAALYGDRLGVAGVIGAYLIALATSVSLNYAIARKHGLYGKPRIDWRLSKRALIYGLKGHLGSLLAALNYRADMFVVAFLLSTAAVGLYSTAVQMAESVWLITSSLGALLLQQTAAGSVVEANRLTPIIARNCLMVSAIICVVLGAVAQPLIVFLFGPSFAPSAFALVVLLPGIAAISFWNILANDLAGRGRPEFRSLGTAIALAVSITLDFLLIPRFGIVGASIASSIAYILNAIVLAWLFVRLTGCKYRDLLVVGRSDFRIYGRIIQPLFKVK